MINKSKGFEDLEVWKRAMDVAMRIYELISMEKFAREYSLKDQAIRAAISISNNISEGYEYDNKKDFIKFLRYAKGSTGEVRNLIIFFLRAKLIDTERFNNLKEDLIILSKQLYAFIKFLKKGNDDHKT